MPLLVASFQVPMKFRRYHGTLGQRNSAPGSRLPPASPPPSSQGVGFGDDKEGGAAAATTVPANSTSGDPSPVGALPVPRREERRQPRVRVVAMESPRPLEGEESHGKEGGERRPSWSVLPAPQLTRTVTTASPSPPREKLGVLSQHTRMLMQATHFEDDD